jgi:carboxypeptidase D
MRLRIFLLFFLMSSIVIMFQSSPGAQNHEEIYARVWVISIEEKGRLLGVKGLDVDAAGPNWLDVVIDSEMLQELKSKGFEVEVQYWTPEERSIALFGPDWDLQFTSYPQLVDQMEQAALDHPDILILDTLGYSVEGRMLLGAKISGNPHQEEDEPEFRIIGCHHGNEYMSVEIPLLMLDYLTDNYGSITQVTHLVDDLETWIIPMMNPDGRTAGTRYNANWVDLNRDYGYIWNYVTPGIFSQPETEVIREHGMKNNFSISLSFHTSGDIVNHVWNYKDFPVADSAFIVDISEEYGSYNGYWVVEGYNWYQTYGDCNDWSYGSRSDIDATIETDNYDIPNVWDLNRDAILAMMERTDDGVRGRITDAATAQPLEGMVRCLELGLPVYCDPVYGDYQKNFLPGTYTLKFSVNGYQDTVISGVVVNEGSPTILNVALNLGSELYAIHVVSCYFYDPYSWPNQYPNNPTNASAALGLPDSIFASLGKGGNIVLDMGENSKISDRPGNDFTIHEVGPTSDGYLVYWSEVPYGGTWHYIGTGYGITSFDMHGQSTDSIRYLKIVDDNDGSATEWYPGCDIDAITHPRLTGGPNLTLHKYYVDDDSLDQSLGNNDGDVDFGETIELPLVLRNLGDSTAYNVIATLRTSHPLASVIDSQKTFGDIPAGDTMRSSDDFVFSVSPEIEDKEVVNFELDITASNGSWTYSQLNIQIHGPVLVYDSEAINDIVGNGNGEADPGETCDMTLTLKNRGTQEAIQVSGELTCDDPYITITSSSSAYPDIPPESLANSLIPYQFMVDSTCSPGYVTQFVLEITGAGPYSASDTFWLRIGRRGVLLVDDDAGESYDTFFVSSLNSFGISYDVWRYDSSGSPSDSVLSLYRAVVWTTGDDHGSLGNPSTLINTDQNSLKNYLDDGGKLFLSSQDLLYDNDPTDFIMNYLHLVEHTDNQGIDLVSGVTDDTISDGISIFLDYPFNNRSDLIVPGSGAAGIFYPPEMTSSFRDNSGQTDYCALRYPDTGTADYQVVFLAFPFEAIPQGGAYPDNANTVMGRILDWFGISKSFTRGDVNKDGEVNVTDVVYLINYLFKNGPEPQPWESGDVNCDNEVSVSDVVYLIFYLFREGPPPC